MFSPTPFPQSFWAVEGLLCAGCYPGDLSAPQRDAKLNGLLGRGIRRVLNLMEAGEVGSGGRPFDPYVPRLQELARARGAAVECLGLPIRDARAPAVPQMAAILAVVRDSVERQIPTYLHCWGGHGRTSTAIACYLIEGGQSAEEAIAQIQAWRAALPKAHYPFEGGQEKFVRSWRNSEGRP